jgi:SAM-dependent methyltransferase
MGRVTDRFSLRKLRMAGSLNVVRKAWDRRASENARYYAATGQLDWSDAEFFHSGDRTVDDFVWNDLANVCQGRDPKAMRVLEIGCGAGRVTRALARRFGEVCTQSTLAGRWSARRLWRLPIAGTLMCTKTMEWICP